MTFLQWDRSTTLTVKPKLHLLRHVTTSRHDKHDVSCESWRDVSSVLRRACCNMADDEEAVVLTCKTISRFIIIYYFSSQMKVNFTAHIK